MIQPARLGEWRMPIDHERAATVVPRPIEPRGQAILVPLAGGLAVEAELPDLSRSPALHLFLQARMRDDQFAVVENIVAYLPVEEVDEIAAIKRIRFELAD